MATSEKTKKLQKQLEASKLADKVAAEAAAALKRQEQEAANKAAVDPVKEEYDWTTDSNKHWAGVSVYADGSAVITSYRWTDAGSSSEFTPEELKRLRDYLNSCDL